MSTPDNGNGNGRGLSVSPHHYCTAHPELANELAQARARDINATRDLAALSAHVRERFDHVDGQLRQIGQYLAQLGDKLEPRASRARRPRRRT